MHNIILYRRVKFFRAHMSNIDAVGFSAKSDLVDSYKLDSIGTVCGSESDLCTVIVVIYLDIDWDTRLINLPPVVSTIWHRGW